MVGTMAIPMAAQSDFQMAAHLASMTAVQTVAWMADCWDLPSAASLAHQTAVHWASSTVGMSDSMTVMPMAVHSDIRMAARLVTMKVAQMAAWMADCLEIPSVVQ